MLLSLAGIPPFLIEIGSQRHEQKRIGVASYCQGGMGVGMGARRPGMRLCPGVPVDQSYLNLPDLPALEV